MSDYWSSLSDEVKTLGKGHKTSCTVADELRTAGGEEAYSSVQRVIDTLYNIDPRKNQLNGSALLRRLQARGVEVRESSLKRHIRKECSCFYRKVSE